MTETVKERRAHKRFNLTCPVVVCDSSGRELLRTRTLNISDGGALVTSAEASAMPPGQALHANLRVPRTTPNTFMYEDFFSAARVARHDRLAGDMIGVALQFPRPLTLELEV
jgi:c-di-GMP-binding flagellar brake protein YcgR